MNKNDLIDAIAEARICPKLLLVYWMLRSVPSRALSPKAAAFH